MAKELKSKKPVGGKLILLANILLILGLGVSGGYYFKKYHDLKKSLPADVYQQIEVQNYINKVAKLYGPLPKDEKPSAAVVNDTEQVKNQAFFAKAEKADVALIYSKAALAILYRPRTNQIINVSSVSIQATQPKVVVIGEATARANVEKTLKDKFSADTTVSGSTNAKTTHSGITVVDLTGQQSDAAKKLAAGLGGQVGGLPDGEDKPAGADILIIAGS